MKKHGLSLIGVLFCSSVMANAPIQTFTIYRLPSGTTSAHVTCQPGNVWQAMKLTNDHYRGNMATVEVPCDHGFQVTIGTSMGDVKVCSTNYDSKNTYVGWNLECINYR